MPGTISSSIASPTPNVVTMARPISGRTTPSAPITLPGISGSCPSRSRIVERTSDQIVAGIFSLSTSTPHMFGEQRQAFEADLRYLLHEINPSGIFSEQTREIAADIWRPLG